MKALSNGLFTQPWHFLFCNIKCANMQKFRLLSFVLTLQLGQVNYVSSNFKNRHFLCFPHPLSSFDFILSIISLLWWTACIISAFSSGSSYTISAYYFYHYKVWSVAKFTVQLSFTRWDSAVKLHVEDPMKCVSHTFCKTVKTLKTVMCSCTRVYVTWLSCSVIVLVKKTGIIYMSKMLKFLFIALMNKYMMIW